MSGRGLRPILVVYKKRSKKKNVVLFQMPDASESASELVQDILNGTILEKYEYVPIGTLYEPFVNDNVKGVISKVLKLVSPFINDLVGTYIRIQGIEIGFNINAIAMKCADEYYNRSKSCSCHSVASLEIDPRLSSFSAICASLLSTIVFGVVLPSDILKVPSHTDYHTKYNIAMDAVNVGLTGLTVFDVHKNLKNTTSVRQLIALLIPDSHHYKKDTLTSIERVTQKTQLQGPFAFNSTLNVQITSIVAAICKAKCCEDSKQVSSLDLDSLSGCLIDKGLEYVETKDNWGTICGTSQNRVKDCSASKACSLPPATCTPPSPQKPHPNKPKPPPNKPKPQNKPNTTASRRTAIGIILLLVSGILIFGATYATRSTRRSPQTINARAETLRSSRSSKRSSLRNLSL